MRHPRTAILTLIATAVAGFAAADLVNPDYDPIAETASRYVNGTAGWLIPTALTAMSAAAALLWWRLRGVAGAGRRSALSVFAAGIAVAAVFPADPPGQYHAPSTSEMVHGLGGWTAFIALPIAALLLSGRIGGRGLRVTAWATVVATAVFAVFLVDVMGGPSLRIGSSESLVGLTERVALAADLAWLAVAALAGGRSASARADVESSADAASGTTGSDRRATATGSVGDAAPVSNAQPNCDSIGCEPRFATVRQSDNVQRNRIGQPTDAAGTASGTTGQGARAATGPAVPASGTGSSAVVERRG